MRFFDSRQLNISRFCFGSTFRRIGSIIYTLIVWQFIIHIRKRSLCRQILFELYFQKKFTENIDSKRRRSIKTCKLFFRSIFYRDFETFAYSSISLGFWVGRNSNFPAENQIILENSFETEFFSKFGESTSTFEKKKIVFMSKIGIKLAKIVRKSKNYLRKGKPKKRFGFLFSVEILRCFCSKSFFQILRFNKSCQKFENLDKKRPKNEISEYRRFLLLTKINRYGTFCRQWKRSDRCRNSQSSLTPNASCIWQKYQRGLRNSSSLLSVKKSRLLRKKVRKQREKNEDSFRSTWEPSCLNDGRRESEKLSCRLVKIDEIARAQRFINLKLS